MRNVRVGNALRYPFSHSLIIKHIGPEQLQPFEGIEGFTADSVSFQGTLFRFPLSGALDPREFLDSYYEEATLSLLFMKNIASISFRNKSSELANWSVTSTAAVVPEKPHISHLTITRECFSEAGEYVRSESIWCVISGRQDEIPSKLEKTSKRHRLEAKYGLAALISAPPEGGLCGKYFISLPLRMGGIPGFPVHLNAVRGVYIWPPHGNNGVYIIANMRLL